jgi:hypothetical protein
MRGFLQPAVRHQPTDPQQALRALSRHRRTKVARAAQTTLVKADSWARGRPVPAEVASALERALDAFLTAHAKKRG